MRAVPNPLHLGVPNPHPKHIWLKIGRVQQKSLATVGNPSKILSASLPNWVLPTNLHDNKFLSLWPIGETEMSPTTAGSQSLLRRSGASGKKPRLRVYEKERKCRWPVIGAPHRTPWVYLPVRVALIKILLRTLFPSLFSTGVILVTCPPHGTLNLFNIYVASGFFTLVWWSRIQCPEQ